ncbi:MAG TPA: S8 family serine peptidase [Gemmatimonadales bacterium]|jgi:subtilisin family serine protease
MRWSIAAISGSVVVLFACSESQIPTEMVPGSGLADVVVAPSGQGVPNRYIIVLKQNAAGPAAEAQRMVGLAQGRLHFVYTKAIKGFAADLSPRAVQMLRADPSVALIEQDRVIKLETTQNNPVNWGLDRIDQRNLPLSLSYTYNRTGAGVHFYGIDTGINLTHNDLAGRVGNGFDAVTAGGNAADCNGHGTHTATTAAGTTFGVAKGATVHPVRVLDCGGSGTTSGVIAGVDWVSNNHQSPAVANMSLGGGASTALDQAVANSVASGVVYAVSAGNNNVSACTQSPARTPSVLTVAASNKTDKRASFSNFGTCVDIFAPGVAITAGWIGGNTTATISGTSMASPHVAGVALQYLEAHPSATPSQVASAITSNASTGKIKSPGSGSPNRLLYMGFITGGGGGNQPPVANFTASCNASHSCTFTSTSTDDVGIVAYEWKRPSGVILGNTSVITASFPSAGARPIILTVTDGGGLTGTITKTINVP